MNVLDLKKYCIETAVKTDPLNVVNVAKNLYEFLDDTHKINPAQGVDQKTERKVIVKKWFPVNLTTTQKATLSKAIEMHQNAERINGVSIARHMKVTSGAINLHLKVLVRNGFMRRQGNKYTPLKNWKGDDLPIILTKLPPGCAIGYKPLTQNIGSIGRVSM